MPTLHIQNNILKISSGEDYVEVGADSVCLTSHATPSACFFRQEGDPIRLSTSQDSMILSIGSLKFLIKQSSIVSL